MYQIRCTLTGLIPMLQDRFFNPEETEKGQAKLKGRKDKRKEVELKLHRDKKGVFVPTDAIRMMLIGNRHRKGAAMILGSYIEKKKGTEYTVICKSFIWVVGIDDPLKVYIKPIRKTMDDELEKSFINAAKSRSISIRPLINLPWSLTFIIQVTNDNIAESKVREFFDTAGFCCGVGAYGPDFGRFMIDEDGWEVLSETEKKSKRKKT